MGLDFFSHEVELVAVTAETMRKAQGRLLSCEGCDRSAAMPFEDLLGEITGRGGTTEYVLCEAAKCPACARRVVETTRVSFDGERGRAQDKSDFFDPPLEETIIVLVDENTLEAAQAMIVGCQCCSSRAEVSFDSILDELTGCDPKVTEYVLCKPARCPLCRRQITERTLVLAD
jgi:hypothetical protein